MENLPHSKYQKDKSVYLNLTRAGSQHYETLFMSGLAKAEGETTPRGIPADDFNVFATMVYAFADHRTEFQAIRDVGKRVRHIDGGTATSFCTFIASMPYVDEMISIDLSPANVDRVKEVVEGKTPLGSHWYAWLEIAAILHDIGDAHSFVTFERERPHLYDKLRKWPILNDEEKQIVYTDIYNCINVPLFPRNPYVGINLQEELISKLKPRNGDIIDDIEPLQDLVGTADIYTRVFFSESVDDTLEVVAHAETNGIQFAKNNALSISAHISKTSGYQGFYTPEELQADPTKHLKELPGTAKLFEKMIEEVVILSDAYRVLWEGLEENNSVERKMMRPNSSYGSAVILVGRANYKRSDGNIKYPRGATLVEAIRDDVRKIRATIPDASGRSTQVTMHCLKEEAQQIIAEITGSSLSQKGEDIVVSVTIP